MKKEEKLRYIMYAIKNNANLTIETQNNKKYNIKKLTNNRKWVIIKTERNRTPAGKPKTSNTSSHIPVRIAIGHINSQEDA